MTTTATEQAGELVDLTKRLWPRKGLTMDQGLIWIAKLGRYGMTNVHQAISEFYATDLESAKPAGEPRYRQIHDIAYRLSQEDYNRRRIGADCHPSNEHPEIRYIRRWWELWRDERHNKRWDGTRNEMPEWAQEIISEHAAHGVDLAVWQAWHTAWQEWARFAFYCLPRAVASEKQRMEGAPADDAAPTSEQPEQSGLQYQLTSLHKLLIELPRVGYKTDAAKAHWIDRVEFAAAEYGVELEGATKGYTRDEVPF